MAKKRRKKTLLAEALLKNFSQNFAEKAEAIFNTGYNYNHKLSLKGLQNLKFLIII